MKLNIESIKVLERIRREITKIDELAADILQNGLLQPVVVMALEDGEYQLLAGLRRLRAVQSLGWTEISVNVVSPADAEAALRIEISENEQREAFTVSERVAFGILMKEIEAAKAKERQREGQSLGGTVAGKGRPKTEDSLRDARPASYESGDITKLRSRDAIGEIVGMSGRTYDRAKHVIENASDEVIERLDRGETTIYREYLNLKDKEKADLVPQAEHEHSASSVTPLTHKGQISDIDATLAVEDSELESSTAPAPAALTSAVPAAPAPVSPAPVPVASAPSAASKPFKPKPPMTPKMERLAREEEERIRKNREWDAMSPADKIVDLESRLEAEKTRAFAAESELRDYKERTDNRIYHGESTIEFQKNRIKELEAALNAANTRIKELEGIYEPN